MLKNIKATYFIKLLFSYVDEKQKLKIVKYNKSLQNIININIVNYKFFTGRYIIYESNGIGKEYTGTDNKLVYEGEYFHGERKGKGKEYSYNTLYFEGEYLNGKRHGKGKEYYSNGNLIYEGEYLNGERNGKGKEYDWFNGKLIFEGEYLNGKEWFGKKLFSNGKIININIGKEYEDDKLLFEGEYFNGKRNGKGKEYYYNGKLQFEGEYKNDLKWNGKGYDPDGKIVYELIDGNGKVKEYSGSFSKLIFEGDYLNGKKNGNGKEYFFDIVIFEGEYLNGQRNGKGKEYHYGKLKFEGEYLYDSKLKGKLYKNEKLEYEGEFLYDKKWNGKGYDENCNIIYELINGNGKVKEYDEEL